MRADLIRLNTQHFNDDNQKWIREKQGLDKRALIAREKTINEINNSVYITSYKTKKPKDKCELSGVDALEVTILVRCLRGYNNIDIFDVTQFET